MNLALIASMTGFVRDSRLMVSHTNDAGNRLIFLRAHWESCRRCYDLTLDSNSPMNKIDHVTEHNAGHQGRFSSFTREKRWTAQRWFYAKEISRRTMAKRLTASCDTADATA